MSLTLRFLGTSASRPTVERNVSSIAVIREGETLMFDCGEGTQRQMMRYGISFALSDIFFTHMHADHMLGVIGLLRTLALQGRTEPMNLYGPASSEKLLRKAISLGSEKQHFELRVFEVSADAPLKRRGYSIIPFAVDHGDRIAIGYQIAEETRLGRFNPDKARDMGIPEGPMWGKIHKGESVQLPDGRTIAPSELVGPSRPGRRIVLTGDSRPSESTIAAATGADVLIHEATFATEEAPRALETSHSTAREAAEVAAKAGVRKLVLTHVSARYSRDTSELESEAREVFPATIIARDGMEIDVPFESALPGD
ncbi:MAG TPA: ribonuclease Z [Gemmatimonadaceae bacterium]|jgi:ribonuclease Z|nr:ribonuclease Z [Gemmatimonadaceae bacterium]